MEYEIGAPGKAYTKWAAQMAVGLGTGVPWVMCKQDDAPDPVVSFLFTILYRLRVVTSRVELNKGIKERFVRARPM